MAVLFRKNFGNIDLLRVDAVPDGISVPIDSLAILISDGSRYKNVGGTSWQLITEVTPISPSGDRTIVNVGTGLQGTQGIRGPQGVQGPQGNQGPLGNQGSQGSMGATGYNGHAGPGIQGYEGIQGATGHQGTSGPAGNRGFQGAQGDVGATTSQGLPGAVGPTGLDGSNSVGSKGTPGVQGSRGAQGSSGLEGFKGHRGNPGNLGPQGNGNVKGAQGAQGRQGDPGDGIRGPQGDSGPQGYQGTTTDGQRGYQGDIGSQGFGTQGQVGPQGNIGPQGSVGRVGRQGDVGFQGNMGVQGSQGSIVEGSRGPQGSQGYQGISSDVQGYAGYTGVTSDGLILIESKYIDSNTSSVTFSGLDGDVDKNYLLISRCYTVGTPGTTYLTLLKPNGLATNVSTSYRWSRASTTSYLNWGTNIHPVSNYSNGSTSLTITKFGAKTGMKRYIYTDWSAFNAAASTLDDMEFFTTWTDTTTNVTSIVVEGLDGSSAASCIGAGSTFHLYKYEV